MMILVKKDEQKMNFKTKFYWWKWGRVTAKVEWLRLHLLRVDFLATWKSAVGCYLGFHRTSSSVYSLFPILLNNGYFKFTYVDFFIHIYIIK